MRAVVGEFMDPAGLALLERELEVVYDPELWRRPRDLQAALVGAHVLVVRNAIRVDRELLERAPRLRVVGRLGSGLDNVDLAAAEARNVAVVYAPEAATETVAEFTLGLVLALARRIPAADRHVRRGGWYREAYLGMELVGKELGVLGFGRIGRQVARKARALGMRVLACHPRLAPDHPAFREAGAEPVGEEELLARADVLTVHLPLTPATRGYLNRERLGQLKPGALLVHVGRGEVLDEAALVQALESGRLGGAALDVRAHEPPPRPDPLARFPQVILTPHIAAFTAEAQRRTAETVARDVLRVLAGLPPLYPARGSGSAGRAAASAAQE